MALVTAGAAYAQPFNFLNGPGAREDTVATSPPPFNVPESPGGHGSCTTFPRIGPRSATACIHHSYYDSKRTAADHANVGGAFSDLIGMTSTATSTSWSPELRITPLIGATSA